MSTHENLDREYVARTGSDRVFGIVFGTIAILLYGVAWFWDPGGAGRVWLLVAGAVLVVLGVIWPIALRPLNLTWSKFGLGLHVAMSVIVLAVLFYGVVTPYGWILRLCGKKLLGLGFRPELDTYWIARDAMDSTRTMKDQF